MRSSITAPTGTPPRGGGAAARGRSAVRSDASAVRRGASEMRADSRRACRAHGCDGAAVGGERAGRGVRNASDAVGDPRGGRERTAGAGRTPLYVLYVSCSCPNID